MCISYRKRHFALSVHPLLYSCGVCLSPVWISQMLCLHCPALVTWLHVRIRGQRIASLLRIDAKQRRQETHTSFPVSAGTHPRRQLPPSSSSSSHSLSAVSASEPLTHSVIYIKGGDSLSAFNALTAARHCCHGGEGLRSKRGGSNQEVFGHVLFFFYLFFSLINFCTSLFYFIL